MKICFLNHDLKNYTGCGRFALSLIKALKKLDSFLETKVLTAENSGRDKEIPILANNKIKLLLSLLKIRSAFKDCDIIHALDGWPYGIIAAICSKALRKKLIITGVGTGAVKPLYLPVESRLLKWAYRQADVLTAISHNTRKEILKKVPDLNIEVINHGVEYEKFSPFGRSPEGEQIKSQIPISNFKPYILSVGTSKPRKGFEYSIRAFAEVSEKFPDLKYLIVGDIYERKELKKLVENLNLGSRIKVFSRITEEELISFYKNAELFILLPCDDNKDIEGFGLVFLEAAAAGCPGIGTFSSSSEDVILNGKTGFLVRPENFQEAAQAAVKILSDKSLRERFSKNAAEFARSMTWSKIAEKYRGLYKKVVYE